MNTTVPPIVFDYLKEGNSKEDLIEWIWSLLPDGEREEIIKEATDQFTGEPE